MLLDLGVPANRICIVSPDYKPGKSCFNNREVDYKVTDSLLIHQVHSIVKELGIACHRGYRIYLWGENEDKGISSVVIKHCETGSMTKIENVKLFLYADEKTVSPDTFRAVNDSYLVFDGRLVIDKYFRTQDPFM